MTEAEWVVCTEPATGRQFRATVPDTFLGVLTCSHKIDESALHIQASQLHLDLVTDFEPLLPSHHPPLGRRLQQPNPRSFVGGTRDQSIEGLPNAVGK